MEFRELIFSCVNSVHYSILFNGSLCGSFTPERGLLQGDPLSPLLFIICFEFLSRLIYNKEEGKIHGIKVSQNAHPISHLMYADDLLIMCCANPSEALAHQ